ncbi:UBP-type zinc finger protein [Streptomyces sp. XY431]|uniref:UBP-type zinc finger domain-containing protein n=1 Tax=Streptomyces sp. XY431 TaxID=1415562 RepID=UPI0006AE5502|nr:UBP-type zinc finger domain-containing protein [Streptomyces sp. XY431]KOV37371.1 UBP-type zinc finger protein [Streptomyces sp. XY431]
MDDDQQDQGIDPSVPPSGDGCVECLAGDGPGWWLHLRRCAACGHIGCCDSSPSQHGTRHARAAGHPFLASFEPGEEWFWNIETEQYYEGPELAAPAAHPLTQPTPGPLGKVPADWQLHLH